jgi:tetratricopeptide (TPR) repeat protein
MNGWRNNLMFGLAMWLTASPIALAQRPSLKKQEPAPPNRSLQVKEIRSGGALDGRGRLWAVVIGVSSYKNLKPEDQLEFAHRDAQDFAAFLSSPVGGGFPSSQLTLLVNQAATLSAIRSALGTTLPRSVEADDMVVIFFAGHGVVEGEQDGYLLAHDSDPQNLYATALQVSELNRIITTRIKARTVILIADACHSGQLGWTSRGSNADTVLVNKYLDEVGKSGKGVFRILASRADQRSYEDKRWGGGHGCFTWFLLEGLKGKADRDQDGFVRIGELLDFLSEQVPKATQALQQPRAAGDIDTRLPLAVLPTATAKVSSTVAASPQLVTLEVHGTPGMEVYLDSAFRGRVLPTGLLMIDQVKPGDHDISIISPGAEPVNQKVSLTAAKTTLALKPAGATATSPLAAQIKQALSKKDVRGALDLYQQLVKQSPNDPQRPAIEASLSAILESIGQNAINVYVQSSGIEIRRGMFQNAAEAFRLLRTIQPQSDKSVEAKYLFCDGRAKIEEMKFEEAAAQLNRAVTLDPRAAYAYNALGLAYREMKKEDRALDALKRAAELAPQWALPQIQIGLTYLGQGRSDKAEGALKEAARLDARHFLPHEQLARIYLTNGKMDDAEREAKAAIALAPTAGLSQLTLGVVYENTKRWDLAVTAYEKGLSLMPNLSSSDREEYTKRAERCRKKGKS